MATPHIESREEDISNIVLMPGDPLRAKMIAEEFLTDSKLVNTVRGMLAYTGYYKGKKVTVFASGMGNASIGIYSYELFKFYNVDKIIRIGSCGAYHQDIDLYSIILVDKSYSKSVYANILDGEDIDYIESSKDLSNHIRQVAQDKNISLYCGNIYCTDVFYSETDNIEELYYNKGCLGTEMESFALFANAKKLNKEAACILTVSDNLVTKQETTSEERQNSFTTMIKLALESIL